MKIIYLHGLDASPSPEKVAIMRERGHEVCAPHTNYRAFAAMSDAFNALRQTTLDSGAEFIVGSSFGGLLGYHIGQSLGLPQLLFNPALTYTAALCVPPQPEREALRSWVVLGTHDDTVPPQLSLDFFGDKPACRVILCRWLGHRIDTETFEQMLRWAAL